MQGRFTTSDVLPFENEWEWESDRLSCSLFAEDDENTEQVIWDLVIWSNNSPNNSYLEAKAPQKIE